MSSPTLPSSSPRPTSVTPEELEQLPWEEVQSSNVRRVAFLEGNEPPSANQLGTVLIEYHSQDAPKVYAYEQVPKGRFKSIAQAKSVGSMVNKTVKGKHPWTKLQVEEPEPDLLSDIEDLKARMTLLESEVQQLTNRLKAQAKSKGWAGG